MVKKALCVGLNYPNQKYQLYGCINDCLDWEHHLKDSFGFDETRVLIDQNPDGSLCTAPTQIPTRANILAQLGGWLCAGNSPGDCLVFVFAGHGCQVRNSYGQIDEALVPEDYTTVDEHGQHLVFDDELHALFARLPSGCFLTVVLDCCHATHMLDVSCCMDASSRPPKTVQVCERPREVNRTDEVWQQSVVSHAMARPRFVPTVSATGPRQRRTAEGAGAHVGRMTLDPGVTAFCFAAARTGETALDANIKAHQRGVMSFCLIEALAALRNRCTYEMLLEKASAKMDDIREKYMPTMDQYIQLTFCPNSAPSEVVVLDERYASVAQHRLSQRARMAERSQSGDGLRSPDGCPTPVREVSTEFVPSPVYNPPDRGQASGGGPSHQPSVVPIGGPPGGRPAPAPPTGTMPSEPSSSYRGPPPNNGTTGTLFLAIHAGYNLSYRDAGCDPFVVARVGHQEHTTPTIHNSSRPVWSEGNRLTFHVGERDGVLEMEAKSGYSSLGRTSVDLRTLPPGQWHRRRDALREGPGGGELEFDVRLELGHQANHNHGNHSPTRARPPSPVRQQAPPPQDVRAYSEQNAGVGLGACPDQFGASGGGLPGGYSGGPPPMQQLSHQPAPVLPEGGNMFGTPNLFGAMPNLMSGMFAANANANSAPPTMGGGSYGPPTGMQAPNRALSGQMSQVVGLGGPFAGASGTPTGAPNTMGLLGAQGTLGAQGGFGAQGGAVPGVPNATIGIDINLNGHTDLVVSGPDLNRDGIPDILQQGQGGMGQPPAAGVPQPTVGGMPQAQAAGMALPQGGGFPTAAPVRAAPPVTYAPVPGSMPVAGAYAQQPVAVPAPLGFGAVELEPVARGCVSSGAALGGYACPYPRHSRLY